MNLAWAPLGMDLSAFAGEVGCLAAKAPASATCRAIPVQGAESRGAQDLCLAPGLADLDRQDQVEGGAILLIHASPNLT